MRCIFLLEYFIYVCIVLLEKEKKITRFICKIVIMDVNSWLLL